MQRPLTTVKHSLQGIAGFLKTKVRLNEGRTDR